MYFISRFLVTPQRKWRHRPPHCWGF